MELVDSPNRAKVSGMRIAEWTTWVAVGFAITGVALVAWQLRKAHRRTQLANQHANRVQVLVEQAEQQAARAEREAQHSSSQARWAWEQVKLAAKQLEQAQSEHQASSQAEHWEWSYALTACARDAVDASSELIRIALDSQIAPHYRLAAERHYDQAATRWQETMTKTLSRTQPSLELQHQVLTFNRVQHQLHGRIGVLLRAAETGAVSASDQLSQQVIASGQELETVRRHLQRTVNDSLVGGHVDSANATLHATAAQRVRELESGPITALISQPIDTARPDASHQQANGALGQTGPAPEQRSGSRRDVTRQSTARPAAQTPSPAPATPPVTHPAAPNRAAPPPVTPPPATQERSTRQVR
jgi:hypothetical protein